MATARIVELNDVNICKLCNNALGKYTCPRCNTLYCSLVCYQADKHTQCSESFYRECVSQEFSLGDTDGTSKTKMLEILKRLHEENVANGDGSQDDVLDSDDEEYLDLGDRLAGIDLNDPARVWEQLNSDERQEFEAFLRSGDMSKYIPQWQPWWLKYYNESVLNVDEFDEHKKTCPMVMENIRDFSSISKKTPANYVQYNLINILGAYSFTLRYFNGEPYDYCKEAVSCVSTLSLTLKVNQNFESYVNAVDSVQQECLSTHWIYTDEENIKLMKEDVHNILQGPHKTENKLYILCALSDVHKLFKSSLVDNKDRKRDGFSKMFPDSKFPEVQLETKTKIKKHIKKFEYLLSYVKDCL